MAPRMQPRNPLDGGAQYPQPNIPSFAAAREQSPSMGSGSFTAMMITLASTAIGIMLWLTYRFLKQRNNTEQAKATKKNGNLSVATQVANAMHRAKGVAVWLKAIRYVQHGITDDHLFKKVSTGHVPSSYASPANPFLAPVEDDGDASMDPLTMQGHSSTAQAESNLAIIIAVDEPWVGSGGGMATSVQGDGERLAQMFTSMSYFSGSYKTVVFTTKSLAPSSTNLTEVLLQLAASKRSWNNVVVFVSAPARAYPKDYIDASLFRNAHTDLTKIERFSRSADDSKKGTSASSDTATTGANPFLGSVGVEFLALRDAPEEPASWIDLALLLDRVRLATRRHADDPPIVCLFDGAWSWPSNGVRASVGWMDTEGLPVKFDTTEEPGAGAAPSPPRPQERLIVSREELSKFRPDEKLMAAIEALTLSELLEQSLRLYDPLSAVVLSSEGGARTTPAAGGGKKKLHTIPGAAPAAWHQRAASLWCDAILKGYHQSQQPTATASTPLPSSLCPSEDGNVMGGLVAPPSHSGDVASSLFHYGRMTTETITMHLQCHGGVGGVDARRIGTILTYKGAKGATVPVAMRPVPLATQVAMMPRPLHTLPAPSLVDVTAALSPSEAALIVRLGQANGPSCVTLSGRSACRTTLFAKQVVWNGDVLRTFANGVVYVDLRDFQVLRRGAAGSSPNAAAPQEDGALPFLPQAAMERLLVDVIGYVCRCAGITCQVSSVGEALRVVHRVLFHPEGKYLIVIDHCDAEFARFFGAFLPHATAAVAGGGGGPATSCSKVVFVGGNDDRVDDSTGSFVLPAVPTAALVKAIMAGCGAQEEEAVRRVQQGIKKLIDDISHDDAGNSKLQLGDTDDVLRLAQHWVRRLVKHEQQAIREGSFVLEDWRIEEILATTVQEAIFEETRATLVCGATAGDKRVSPTTGRAADSKDRHDATKQRLIVLQATLLAPLLFRVHAARVPFHLVRLTSMMFGGLAVQQVCTTFQELVESGLLLSEYVSFATDSTSQSTLVEDAHAAMVDATGVVRVNALLAEHPLCKALLHFNFQTAAEDAQHHRPLHSTDDVVANTNVSGGPAVLADAARVAILTSLLPFMTAKRFRPESRHDGIYWETICLMASLKAHALPIESIGLPMCALVSTQLCSPQCLMAVLEQCSVGRLSDALQQTIAVLEQLELHIQHRHKESQSAASAGGNAGDTVPSGADAVLEARNRLRSTLAVLQDHHEAIHRNHLELWTHLRLEASYMADDDTGATPVLAVEPLHGGTIVQPDAFDGTMLLASHVAAVDARAAVGPSSPVTALLFVAKTHLVVGYADGSIASIAVNHGDDPSVLVCVAGDRSGHGGSPITDLIVVRHGGDDGVRLVSCSRANNVAREWSGGLYELQDSVEVPLTERRGGRVYFPFAPSLSEAAQYEQTQQHRFFSKLVRPVTNAAAIAQSYFGHSHADGVDGRSSGGDGNASSPIATHAAALGACRDTTLLLQYGLPDMHRGAQFNDVMGGGGDLELNTVAITHADGMSLCASSFTLPALQGATCSVCGEDERGHLLVAVGTSAGAVQILRIMKEV